MGVEAERGEEEEEEEEELMGPEASHYYDDHMVGLREAGPGPCFLIVLF